MILKFPQQKKLLTIIIPVYNEKNTIDLILNKVILIKIEKEIIIVDDGSTDGTSRKLNKYRKNKKIKIIRLQKNFGKGYAIKQALNLSTGGFIIIQDADLEYDPSDILKLLKPVKLKGAKFVIGSRVLSRKINKRPKGFISYILVCVNSFFSLITSLIVKQKITDPQSCYKLFSREIAKKINLQQNGFAFCNEIIFEVRKLGIKIHEVPISYNGRSYDQGKKINIKDGTMMLFFLIKNFFFK